MSYSTTNSLIANNQPWKVRLSIAWLAMLLTFTCFGTVFPFLPLLVQELGNYDYKSASLWAGIISASASSCMVFTAPIWGRVSDLYGRKLPVIIGVFGFGFLMLLAGFTTNIKFLWLTWVGFGIFPGPGMVTLALVSDLLPKKHLTYGIGIFTSSNFIGFAIGPLLGGYIIDNLGFRPSFVIGFICLIIAGTLILFLIPNIRMQQSSQYSLNPLKIYPESLQFIKNSNLKPVYFIIVLVMATGCLTMPVIPLFFKNLVDDNNAGIVTGICFAINGIVGGIAAFAVPYIKNHISPINITVCAFLLSGIIHGAFISINSVYSTYIVLAIASIFHGAAVTLATSMLAENSGNRKGTSFGIAHSISSIAWGGAPFIGGYAGKLMGLRSPFLVNAFLCILSAIYSIHISKENNDLDKISIQKVNLFNSNKPLI